MAADFVREVRKMVGRLGGGGGYRSAQVWTGKDIARPQHQQKTTQMGVTTPKLGGLKAVLWKTGTCAKTGGDSGPRGVADPVEWDFARVGKREQKTRES